MKRKERRKGRKERWAWAWFEEKKEKKERKERRKGRRNGLLRVDLVWKRGLVLGFGSGFCLGFVFWVLF